MTHTLPLMPKFISIFLPVKEKILAGVTVIQFHLYMHAHYDSIEATNKGHVGESFNVCDH